MNATLLGALAWAGVLGVTHAVEPDHVAGISSLTSRYGDPRLSALVGACFSAGHVALVVGWLGVGYLLLGKTEFAPVYEHVGTLGVAVVLGVLGSVMAVGGLRTVLHGHAHEHDGEVHSHSHLHLPLIGSGGHSHADGHGDHEHHGHADEGEDAPAHEHDHGVVRYLKTGLVGALFTLSPPLSMIAFAATLFPDQGVGAVALSVVVYAVAITVTMSAIGAGVGSLFGAVAEDDDAFGVLRAVGGVAVAGLGAWLGAGAVAALA